MNKLTYAQARRLIVIVGLAVLLVVAAVMYARRVDPIEVMATLLFIPIFLAFVFGSISGGLVAGILATAAYVFLRSPAIDAVGADHFTGLIASRGLAYLAFGILGGWANKQLESSVEKLELHDQIDDQTGLYNARFLVGDIDLEISRADRYKTIFSLALVDVPLDVLTRLGGRKQRRVVKELGNALKNSVRTVDRVAHARTDKAHLYALVLPETGQEGARILTGRLAQEVTRYLGEREVDIDISSVPHVGLTYPMDADEIQGARHRFEEIAHRDFPEAPRQASPGRGPEARKASG